MTLRTLARRRWVRFTAIGLVAAVLLCLVGLAGVVFAWASFARTLPDLHGWHVAAPRSEFKAADATSRFSFDDYLAREDTVFKELDALVNGAWANESVGRFCRFQAGSICNPATLLDRNWNRTYVLESPAPIGGALLVHGLSDSPYSLRALAERLHGAGYTVIGLRVPGHGTCPKALAQVSWEDWVAAVDVAMRGLRDRVPAGAPLIMVGYSNGGALCVHHAALSLRSPSPDGAVRPDRIVLFSPMIGISPMAQFTDLFPTVAALSGEKKLAWSAVEPEIDPFKYSSWPINASMQAYRLTRKVEAELTALVNDGLISRFPPVLAVQSAADSTVVAPRLIDILMNRLPAGGSAMLLFDVNRSAWLDGLTDMSFERELRPELSRTDLTFAFTLITNRSPESPELVARTREGGEIIASDLGASWPRDVFSLSHVALSIPPSDPVYGAADPASPPRLPLGTLSLRGENGVLAISPALLTRMRFNPFYDWTEQRIMDWIGEHVAK